MKKISLIIAILALSVLLSACSISLTSSGRKSQAAEAGVFVSVNRGDTWKNMSLIPTITGKPGSLSQVSIRTIEVDPSDSQALYLATYEQGLFYTHNLNDGWQRASGLTRNTINDVAVDPQDKCNIYAAIGNRVYASQDCARSWEQVYFDNNPGVIVTKIVIDHYNPQNLYIATSRGEVIKSIDQGFAWRTIYRFDEGVSHLTMSPQDSRLLFVGTVKNKLYSFKSNSITFPEFSEEVEINFDIEDFMDLNPEIKDFKLGNFRELVICPEDDMVYLIALQKILRSADHGLTWEEVNIIPPEKDAIINAFALNPQNSQEIYYVTNTTFFRSLDGGVSWNNKRLPTTAAGWSLLVNPENSNIVYLGIRNLEK